jgi:myo-inositol-1(or 4)-monophosphatase
VSVEEREDDVHLVLLALATELARSAGALLLTMRQGPLNVRTKSSLSDAVSLADEEAQALILRGIAAARPLDGVVAEEGANAAACSGYTWIVDPLDGTTNYLRGYPGWAVSIAVHHDERPCVAVVFDPMADALYSAVAGRGATRNGVALRIGGAGTLEEAIVATGFSYRADRRQAQGVRLSALLPRVADIRRSGSAALELCHVAEGSVDAFAEDDLELWDWAAGELLVLESGGVCEAWNGLTGGTGLLASSPALLPLMRPVLGLV